MAVENTDLERRVLAHEQILQALISQLSRGEPEFLRELAARFASSRSGAHAHDYTETADYAEQFIKAVVRLNGQAGDQESLQTALVSSLPAPKPAPAKAATNAVVVRVAKRHGVWHLTRDAAFVGDYFGLEETLRAAATLAREIELSGRCVELELGEAALRRPA